MLSDKDILYLNIMVYNLLITDYNLGNPKSVFDACVFQCTQIVQNLIHIIIKNQWLWANMAFLMGIWYIVSFKAIKPYWICFKNKYLSYTFANIYVNMPTCVHECIKYAVLKGHLQLFYKLYLQKLQCTEYNLVDHI